MNMKNLVARFFRTQQSGLILVIIAIIIILSLFAGSHEDKVTGKQVNNFLNKNTLVQTATDASFFAVMAIGATLVIISGGIDLSVGSIYALAGVIMALALRSLGQMGFYPTFLTGMIIALGIGLVCGLINGSLIVGLKVHPFIITLGSMWVLRGLAFVTSKAESILLPDTLTQFAKATFGLSHTLYPVPMLVMFFVAIIGEIYLSKTVMGRNIFAVGGNIDAARYSGLRLNRILIGVYVISGLCSGIAAFVGSSFYGSATCSDATGYELYVIASAVVGGASLNGGKGSVLSAMLGAILIILIRQSIRTLHLDQNYEWIIIGCAIIVAVVLDQINAKLAKKRLLAK